MTRIASRKPLANCRLVATLPPKRFFGGNNLLRAYDQIAALKRLGAAVYLCDTDAFYRNDEAEIARQTDDIVAFRPDAVVGTPHAGYVVQGGMTRQLAASARRYRNLFLDDLELPAVLYWDHALTQAARYWLTPWPDYPRESNAGALDSLAELFRHPRVVHFFSDTGHARFLGDLGIASSDQTAWYVQEVAKPFVQMGYDPHDSHGYDEDVAFYGNLYLAASKTLAYSEMPGLVEIRTKAQAACAVDWSLSAFHAYSEAIDGFDAAARSSLRLDCDQSFYWHFLFEELSRITNGEHRLNVLRACGRPIACFGNFNDPDSSELLAGHCAFRGCLSYDASLASAFRRTRVVVDVANAVFINGFSVKPIACLAAGGFVLTNRKADLVRALGPTANEIIYENAEDLAGKVDRFLSNDRARAELTQELGSMIRRSLTAEALFAETLPPALERLRASSNGRGWKGVFRSARRSVRQRVRAVFGR